MKRFLALVSVLVAFASLSPAWAAPIAVPIKKKCTMGVFGGEGCSVTVEMSTSPHSPCSPGCPEYCVTIKVNCPGGIPPGDVPEECESTNCEICCGFTNEVSVDCDGQCFKAQPKPGKNWTDVKNDCSHLSASAAAGPC